MSHPTVCAIAPIRGVNLVYRVIGEGGPWVALITGGRRGHGEFIPLAEKIAAYGYRVLLHDRRNTGASDILIDDRDDDGSGEEGLWTDDLAALLAHLGAAPAFVGGSSSGARTSMLFALRHPALVRGLLLFRVTGGAVAAKRLPENYYAQFIRAAQAGGMAGVCETEQYRERIAANPANRARLMAMAPARYIAVMQRWMDVFVAGAGWPVMGMPPQALARIVAPAIVIPGNDQTHSSASGRLAQQGMADARLHELPIVDEDVPLLPFEAWAPQEAEIARVFAAFMADVAAAPASARPARALRLRPRIERD